MNRIHSCRASYQGLISYSINARHDCLRFVIPIAEGKARVQKTQLEASNPARSDCSGGFVQAESALGRRSGRADWPRPGFPARSAQPLRIRACPRGSVRGQQQLHFLPPFASCRLDALTAPRSHGRRHR